MEANTIIGGYIVKLRKGMTERELIRWGWDRKYTRHQVLKLYSHYIKKA